MESLPAKELTRTFVQRTYNDSGQLTDQKVQKVKYFDDEKGYLFWLNRECVKTYKGCGLPDKLTETETARVYRLSLTMRKNSNLIYYKSGNSFKAMGLSQIARYLKISQRQAAAFISKMIFLHIIGKVRVNIGRGTCTQYYINPCYFFNGKWLNANLYLLFRKDLDHVLPSWVKDRFADDSAKGTDAQ